MMPPSQTDRLRTDIWIVYEMMLKVHYYHEAQWLCLAATCPDFRATEDSRDVLQNAGVIARQFGFGNVANWIRDEVLR